MSELTIDLAYFFIAATGNALVFVATALLMMSVIFSLVTVTIFMIRNL